MTKSKSFLLASKNIFRFKFTTCSFSNVFKDKEKVEEKLYIDKQERELLKKLLEKIHKNGQSEDSISSQSQSSNDSDYENLRYILDSHNTEISKDLFNALLKWKKGQL
jgi:hypothetical protein